MSATINATTLTITESEPATVATYRVILKGHNLSTVLASQDTPSNGTGTQEIPLAPIYAGLTKPVEVDCYLQEVGPGGELAAEQLAGSFLIQDGPDGAEALVLS